MPHDSPSVLVSPSFRVRERNDERPSQKPRRALGAVAATALVGLGLWVSGSSSMRYGAARQPGSSSAVLAQMDASWWHKTDDDDGAASSDGGNEGSGSSSGSGVDSGSHHTTWRSRHHNSNDDDDDGGGDGGDDGGNDGGDDSWCSSSGVIYVNANTKGSNRKTGHCWHDAYDSLTTALSMAQAGDEIWVAAGTYKPYDANVTTADAAARYVSFMLKKHVRLFGSFAGYESATTDRDLSGNGAMTVLSGEIGESGSADNSYHVVVGAAGSVLDGFKIAHGNADGTGYDGMGGGLLALDAGELILRRCVFEENTARHGGALAAFVYTRPPICDARSLAYSAPPWPSDQLSWKRHLRNVGLAP